MNHWSWPVRGGVWGSLLWQVRCDAYWDQRAPVYNGAPSLPRTLPIFGGEWKLGRKGGMGEKPQSPSGVDDFEARATCRKAGEGMTKEGKRGKENGTAAKGFGGEREIEWHPPPDGRMRRLLCLQT